MKSWMKIAAVLMGLCLLLNLSACSSEEGNDTSNPTQSTATVPPIDPVKLYEEACQELDTKANLVISFNGKQLRSVGSESYTASSVGTISYAGLGTEEVEALVMESLMLGSYETQYVQSYLSGKGYSRVNNQSFVCEMTAEEFIADQIPAALINAELYQEVTIEENGGKTMILFSSPLALESWVEDDSNAQLTDARGSVTLDESGALTDASYHAVYTLSNASYTLDIATTISTPATLDLSSSQPVYPEKCVSINDLSIPKLLIKTVGDVYATNAMSVSYTDRLYSAVFAVIRAQSSTFHTYGRDDSFICSMATQVAVTDFTGTTTSNSQNISFIDGLYYSSVNGGEPTTSNDFTAEQVRMACEDSILASLIELDCIKKATLTDMGDFLRIDFTGNDSFAQSMCNSIYSVLGTNLDNYAKSHSTPAIGGYLVINKYTGLPTALGMNMERNHVIDDVSYPLTYQLDQSMILGSNTAYESITGQVPEETAPAEAASPLFYKVTGEDGKTMWLLGTIHIGDERTGFLPQQILDALSGSDALAVEFDTMAFEQAQLTDTKLQGKLASALYYSDGGTFNDHLSKEQSKQLEDLILAIGYNSASAPYMKVSIWNNNIDNFYLQQGTDLSSSKGLERRLLKLAKAQEKTIYEIESGLSQIKMLAGFSDAVQKLLLQETLDAGLIGYCDSIEALYELWCQGSEEALTAELIGDPSEFSETEKKYYKALITDRNKTMLKAAVKYLDSDETVFYAVGLAHLLGEDGLVAALQEKGYTVELVTYE